MANKPRSPRADYAAYLAVRIGVAIFQALPLRVALEFGTLFGWVAYHVDKRHREVARDNLRHAFPERCADPWECDQLVRGCFRHFCTMIVEIAVVPRRVHIHNWRKYTDVEDFGRIVSPLMGDRPVLFVTAHYGNWEIGGYSTGVTGLKTYAIARLLDNPYLNRFFLKFREKTGQTILSKTGDFERITKVLEEGAAISTLGDQDAGPKGLFIDFFNRPASTHKAVAILALQHDALMLVVACPRVGTPMRYAWQVGDVIDPREYAGRRASAVKAITQRFTRSLEAMIREHPEQYFWLHRRWKHKPPERKTSETNTIGA